METLSDSVTLKTDQKPELSATARNVGPTEHLYGTRDYSSLPADMRADLQATYSSEARRLTPASLDVAIVAEVIIEGEPSLTDTHFNFFLNYLERLPIKTCGEIVAQVWLRLMQAFAHLFLTSPAIFRDGEKCRILLFVAKRVPLE